MNGVNNSLNRIYAFCIYKFLILIISSTLCYSGTISFNNATFITPENWTTTTWAIDPVWANDSTSRFDFQLGEGYPIYPGPYNSSPDISIFQDGAFQRSNDLATVITQIDSHMFQNLSYYNAWQAEEHAPFYYQYSLIPTAAFLNSQGSIERTYAFVHTFYNPYGSDIIEQGNFGLIVDKNSIVYYAEIIQNPSNNSLSAEESTLYLVLQIHIQQQILYQQYLSQPILIRMEFLMQLKPILAMIPTMIQTPKHP